MTNIEWIIIVPTISMPGDREGIDVLTPGHFLIGRPLESLPDPPSAMQSVTSPRRWNLCQLLTRHFWKRWSADYFHSLWRLSKWQSPSRSFKIGDIVLLQEESLVPTKWPLARVTELHSGRDGIVRVVTVKTSVGIYKRPVVKVALLIPCD